MVRLYTFVALFCSMLVLVLSAPVEYSNPKSQVEYITNNEKPSAVNAFPNIVPITRPPLVTQAAPSPPPNSKNFAYNPMTQTWTLIKPGEELPSEDTLVWNQSNDKWLT